MSEKKSTGQQFNWRRLGFNFLGFLAGVSSFAVLLVLTGLLVSVVFMILDYVPIIRDYLAAQVVATALELGILSSSGIYEMWQDTIGFVEVGFPVIFSIKISQLICRIGNREIEIGAIVFGILLSILALTTSVLLLMASPVSIVSIVACVVRVAVPLVCTFHPEWREI